MTLQSPSNCNNIGVYNFDCVLQNQDVYVDMIFTTGEGEEKEPLDLTVYDQIRLSIKGLHNQIVTTLSLGEGLQIVGEDSNILSITFGQHLTNILKTTKYQYDILFVSNGVNTYFVKGEINVNNTITR
jgi:hypothetical protein